MHRALAACLAVGTALALAGCGEPGPGSLTTLPLTVQAPFPDEGWSADVAAVRRVTQQALSAEVHALRVRPDGARLPAARRVTEVAAFETATLASRVGYDSPVGPIDRFRSAGFRPVRWDGVAVRDDVAKVYVIGHDELDMLDGSIRRDAGWQYQLLLRRDGHAVGGWRVVAENAAGGDRVTAVDSLPAAPAE